MDHFNLLLKDYIAPPTPAPAAPVDVDGYQKAQKARIKAYDDAIAALLKSKNIAPASVPLPVIDTDNSGFVGVTAPSCDNTRQSTLAFLRAAFTDPAVTAGYADFVKIRHQMRGLCLFEENYGDQQPRFASHMPLVNQLATEIGALEKQPGTGAYPLYQAALLNFYNLDLAGVETYGPNPPKASDQNYRAALAQFQALAREVPNSWVGETAAYMVGRVHLILAQFGWDGYSPPQKSVDQAQVAQAKAAFQAYLARYPTGRYAESAKNLNRKILYLEGNQPALNEAERAMLNGLFNKPFYTQAALAAARAGLDEFNRFYVGDVQAQDPPLVMALEAFKAKTLPPQLVAELATRQADFDAYPGLLRFLRAYILLRNEDYAGLLRATPPEPLKPTIAGQSVAAMRAWAFEATYDPQHALQLWKEIAATTRDDQAQLHIAGIDLERADYATLFGRHSGVENAHILADFALFATPTPVLWDVAANPQTEPDVREIAKKALFRRLLLQRDLPGLMRLIPELPDPKAYAAVIPAIRALAKNPDDAAAHVRLGAYIYEHYLRPDASLYLPYNPFTSPDVIAELKPFCPTCAAVPHAVPPMADFLAAKAQMSKSGTRSETDAENLYYLVRCFRGAEYQDRCKWDTKGYENRTKSWFLRLHRLYPASRWAKGTPAYY